MTLTTKLLGLEQLHDPDVLNAKVEGMMCPAVVELIREAFGSSGEKTYGLVGQSQGISTAGMLQQRV